MSSTAGCGAEDIRRSIQSLCQQCDLQAGDQDSKTALKTKCDAILASAPAAPLQRLYEETSPTKGVSQLQGMVGMSPITLGIFGFLIASISMGLVLRIFRSARHTINQQHDEGNQDTQETLAQ